MPVLVVTGVRREAKIAAGPGMKTICSGGSPARLRTQLAGQDSYGITAVMSFGIGGGLNPALMPGHVVVADAVSWRDGRWPTDRAITDALIRALPSKNSDLKVLRASLLGVDEALVDPDEKSHARAQSGAAVVDMESHIAASYALAHGLPFVAVRVVCDPASRSLPPLVNEALNEDGGVSLKGVFGSLVREPGQIGDLIRLAVDSQTAFSALSKAGTMLRTAFAKA